MDVYLILRYVGTVYSTLPTHITFFLILFDLKILKRKVRGFYQQNCILHPFEDFSNRFIVQFSFTWMKQHQFRGRGHTFPSPGRGRGLNIQKHQFVKKSHVIYEIFKKTININYQLKGLPHSQQHIGKLKKRFTKIDKKLKF